MPRPLPTLPRGPRRRRRDPPRLVLAVPRVDPAWELGALQALMKPQAKGAIVHRPAAQPWPADAADAADRVAAACRLARDRLGYDPRLHLPAGPGAGDDPGDFHLVADVAADDLPRAIAFAVVLSEALPGVWVSLGRLFMRDGRFYRRERGFKLRLVPAPNVHLRRDLRAALRGRVTAG